MSNILLQANDLHIGFGGVQAAAGVNLVVHSGEHLAIIGPNGAGKTTFINICTGYLKPQRGRVVFAGRDITARPPRTITRLGIARAFQIPQLFSDYSVRNNLLLALAARGGIWRGWRSLQGIDEQQEADQLLSLFQLETVAGQAIQELPEGLRKLIDIAMALALRPRLLLMDEPTSGVASSEKFAVMDTLMNALSVRAVTSVFVEHDMEVVARYADRVAVWNSGMIQAEGPPDEVLNNAAVLRDVIGM